MMKESKSLRKQALKAERAAEQFEDPEISGEMRALANAYRSQADIVKLKEKAARKRMKAANPANSTTETSKTQKSKTARSKSAGSMTAGNKARPARIQAA